MKVEAAIKFYEAAREEMMKRMKIRDNILIVYLGVITSLFAVAIKMNSYNILLSVPFLTLGASLLIAEHYVAMGRLSFFCASEIAAFLIENKINVPQLDTSETYYKFTKFSVYARCVSYLILTELPPIMALCYNKQHALNSPFPEGVLWWFGLICIILLLVLIIGIHIARWLLYKNEKWFWTNKKRDTKSLKAFKENQ